MQKASRHERTPSSRTSLDPNSPNRPSATTPSIARSSSHSAASLLSPMKKPRKLETRIAPKDRKRSSLAIADPEFYRPLKKPITLRLDADVLAWFKKGGRRYQTRINQALRQVMEREMKK